MGVSMTVIDIQNIVASSSLGTELDLFKILDSFETAQYDPKQFPGLIYRISEPKTATLLFKSGKLGQEILHETPTVLFINDLIVGIIQEIQIIRIIRLLGLVAVCIIRIIKSIVIIMANHAFIELIYAFNLLLQAALQ